MSVLSILLFVGIIALTLLITYFSSKKTKSTSDFYTAGGGLTATQNGLAVAGYFMSAASFLGITGAIALVGFDGFYMSIGNLLGFLFLLYLVAEPMRNLGKYTLADMMTSRFKSNKVRGTAAVSTLVISIFYMIAQLVGGGGLISLMLGIDYWIAVVIVGVLMTVYVIFGGMTATSWVQITKAVLLLGGSFVLSFLVFAKFDFSIIQMFEQIKTASPFGAELANPGNKYSNGLDMLSLNLSLVLGVAGLPHLLIRFFTVKDAVTARKSVVYSTWFIGAFFLIQPRFAAGGNIQLDRYAWLGDNPLEMLQTLLTQPALVFNHLWYQADLLGYLVALFFPTAFLALLSPLTLLPILPTLAVNLLSDNPFTWRLEDFHYGAPLAPFLFISAIYGIRRIAGYLNDHGMTTRSGGKWNMITMRDILRNRTYIGTYTRFGMSIPGAHPPVVSNDLFKAAQFASRKEIVPERIRENRQPYYAALQSADRYWEDGQFNVNELASYLAGLLADQLADR